MTPVRFEGNVPVTLRKIAEKHAVKVAEVTGKGIMYDDAYDVSYRDGWCSASDFNGLHSDYGETVAQLAPRIRDAKPCDCEDCVRELSGVSK